MPAPGSHGSVSHNPILCSRPQPPDRKPYLRNGSFPAAAPASSCSICSRVHFPCCLSDTAGHGRGIPDVLNRTNKSMVRGHGPESPGNPLWPSLSLLHAPSCSVQNTAFPRTGQHTRRHMRSSRLPGHWYKSVCITGAISMSA